MTLAPEEPSRMTTFQTNPVLLQALLANVESGQIQLPDFQRGWVWNDDRIRSLLASISLGFPIGAVMTLAAGGDIRFKARLIEGVNMRHSPTATEYLLDGQQRLTSLYQALKHKEAVITQDNRRQPIKRWYYVDICKSLSDSIDREDAIVSVPESRRITRDFGRELVLDVSNPELEYANHMIPTEQLLNPMRWMLGYLNHWEGKADNHPTQNPLRLWEDFHAAVVDTFGAYQIPVIGLSKGTPKEAVCKVFENVNTGGVTLTVFELVTATFAANDYPLRDDWNARQRRMYTYEVLRGIDSPQFLQAVALLATQQRRRKMQREDPSTQAPRIGCQRRDILNLTLDEYQEWADKVEAGFKEAAKFLQSQFVFKEWDVPYNTQLVPLAALYTELGSELSSANAIECLERWYWAGIFSEVYGGAIETQYALDLVEVANYIRNGTLPRLIAEASFNPERLLSLRTRNSAAYKGLYALQMKNGAKDWKSGNTLTQATYLGEAIEIHHIFPVAWCKTTPPIPSWLYNSIINKTPIGFQTNRSIGGLAPSKYLPRLRSGNSRLDDILESHWLNPQSLETDDFYSVFIERGEKMLDLISKAMGKEIPDGRETFRNALRQGVPEARRPDGAGEDSPGADYADEFDEPEEDYYAIGEAAFTDDPNPP